MSITIVLPHLCQISYVGHKRKLYQISVINIDVTVFDINGGQSLTVMRLVTKDSVTIIVKQETFIFSTLQLSQIIIISKYDETNWKYNSCSMNLILILFLTRHHRSTWCVHEPQTRLYNHNNRVEFTAPNKQSHEIE